MQIQKLWPAMCVVLVLSACSSAPTTKAPRTSVQVTPETREEADVTPDYYLDRAEQAFQSTGDISLRNQWLLRAADTFRKQQACHQSSKILQLLAPELIGNAQTTEAALIEAECLMQLPYPDTANFAPLLDRMARNIGFDPRINHVRAYYFEHQHQWLDAARAWLGTNLDAAAKSQQIWASLQPLSEQQLQAAMTTAGALAPWIELRLIVQRFGLSTEDLQQQITSFSLRHQNHILGQALPDDVSAAMSLTPFNPMQIAVILPLSGRLEAQGQAIKEGMLAAYFERQSTNLFVVEQATQLTFIDSENFAFDMASEALSGFDMVVGPLLRERVQRLMDNLPPSVPLLALNRLDEPAAQQPEHFFFALAPEDEATQLAERVWQQGAQKPVLVAHDSPTTRRMTAAFLARWQALSGNAQNAPRSIYFTDTQSMRDGVTEMLDVAQSKSRISQISRLLTPELHAVPRNRQDIDSIVLFANQEQTELLNPIIESSLSPFNDRAVPVYASSRSYSHALNNNSLRDLQNITFTDMPWMLPRHSWPALKRQFNALWPDRQDTLQRLFALGYDSYVIVPHLKSLKTLPTLTLNGLTGQLHVDSAGRIMRNLPYGYINAQEVTPIAMESARPVLSDGKKS